MATHSSILVWRIPWTEEPGGLQFIVLQRVRHDGSNLGDATHVGAIIMSANNNILLSRSSLRKIKIMTNGKRWHVNFYFSNFSILRVILRVSIEIHRVLIFFKLENILSTHVILPTKTFLSPLQT